MLIRHNRESWSGTGELREISDLLGVSQVIEIREFSHRRDLVGEVRRTVDIN